MLDRKTVDLSNLSLVSLACLLLDQHDQMNLNSFGSWGRSTVDYSLLCTRRYDWHWDRGSITHTAWALQALSQLDRSLLPPPIHQTINLAVGKAEYFVARALREGFAAEATTTKTRHNATCMLAHQFLPRTSTVLPLYKTLEYYNELTREILLEVRTWMDNRTLIPSDIAQIAAYILMLTSRVYDTISQIDLSKGNLPDDLSAPFKHSLASANEVLESIGEFSKELLNRGVRLGTWGDSRVLSPLLQAAMFLHTASISRQSRSCILGSGELYQAAITICREQINDLRSASLENLPQVTVRGILDAWTLIVFSLSGLRFANDLPIEDSDILHRALKYGLKQWTKKHASLFATTIHWSIILQSVKFPQENMWKQNNKCSTLLSRYPEITSRWHNLKLHTLPRLIQNKVGQIAVEKFFYGLGKALVAQPAISSRAVLFSFISKSLEECEWNKQDFNDHINRLYGNVPLCLAPKTNHLHLMIAGYSTSGKSTVCKNLEQSSSSFMVIKRATTRKVPMGDPEAHRFTVLTPEEFEYRRSKGSLIACHKLWGNFYGFDANCIEQTETGSIQIYQVGWSETAIRELKEYLATVAPRDPTALIILRPTIEVLKSRLLAERQISIENVYHDIKDAEKFYDTVENLHSRPIVIDTGQSEAASVYAILLSLQDFFGGIAPLIEANKRTETNYKYDVFLCHATIDKETIVLPFEKALRQQGIRTWIDLNEITLGEDFFRQINNGLRESRYVVAFISHSFIKSEWANKELSAAFVQQMDSRKDRVIPILLGMNGQEFHRLYPLLSSVNAKFFDNYKPGMHLPEQKICELAQEICNITLISQ